MADIHDHGIYGLIAIVPTRADLTQYEIIEESGIRSITVKALRFTLLRSRLNARTQPALSFLRYNEITSMKSHMQPFLIILVLPILVWLSVVGWQWLPKECLEESIETVSNVIENNEGDLQGLAHPLQIEYMRQKEYPGSELIIEQTLNPGINYQRYIVSYKSEGLKQFALLTIPKGSPPANGWPAIVFNHGYIPPDQYKTTERYVAYTDAFSRKGYVLLRPDYRGHGNSDGVATGGYGTPDYTIDVLNAFTSLQKHPTVDPGNIGMWGHSMGGWITQRAMVINPEIKAGVIWGGVVGSYQDIQTEWWDSRRRSNNQPNPTPSPGGRGYWRYQMYDQYGDFITNQNFWDSISSTTYIHDTSGPVQLHHARGDATVPYQLSELFYEKLQSADIEAELYIYSADDHDITANFTIAMKRSVDFFDTYLKAN